MMTIPKTSQLVELWTTPGLLERQPISEDLRALRLARGLSLADAAGRAGLSKAALSQWESWARVPSGPALERLLKAYKVDHRTFARLLTASDPAHAQHALVHKPLGPAVDFSQMLRALRWRAKMTQSELAKAISVSQPAVAKWDSGDTQPSPELLEAALTALGASDSERTALLCAQHRPWSEEDVEEQFRLVGDLPFALREFALMNCQRRFWVRASQSASGDRALCLANYCRGWWNNSAGRYGDAVIHLKQSLRLAKSIGWVDIAALSAVRIAHASTVNDGNADLAQVSLALEKWLDEPLTPYTRGVFILNLLELLMWGGRFIAAEPYAFQAIDLLKDHRSSHRTPPYTGVEDAVGSLAAIYAHQNRPEKGLDTFQWISQFKTDGYQPMWSTVPYLFALSVIGEEPPEDALAVLSLHVEELKDQPGDLRYLKRHHTSLKQYYRGSIWEP